MPDHALSQAEIDALLSGQDHKTTSSSMDDDDLSAIDDLFEAIVHPLIVLFKDLLEIEPIVDWRPVSLIEAEALWPSLKGKTLFSAHLHGAVQSPIVFSLTPEHMAHLADTLGDHMSDEEGQHVVADTLIRCTADALTSVMATSVQGTFDDFQQVNDEKGRNRFLSLIQQEAIRERTVSMTIAGRKLDISILLPVALTTQILGHLEPLVQDDPPVSSPKPPIRPVSTHKEEAEDKGMSQAMRHSTLSEHGNIDLLLDVQLQVTVELGRTRMPIKDLLALGKGSVVELDKLAGEPVEVYVNGKLLAKGEVVTIDEHFGVKITDIVQQSDRVKSLR